MTENSSGSLFTLSASDPDGDTVSLALTGEDASFFTLGEGGAVSFAAPPNYDRFADSDSDNDYVVVAQASDGRGGTVRSTVTVAVTNDREGIRVTRIASGFVDPVGMAVVFGQNLVVAERAGQIHAVNGQDGTITDYRTVALPTSGAVQDIASANEIGVPLFPVVLFSDPGGMSLRFDINSGTPRDVRIATGAPEGAVGKIAYSLNSGTEEYGYLLTAVGDPQGARVGGASGYGALSYVTPPDLAGNSVITPIGRGVRQAGGWISQKGFVTFFADQGGSVAHELNSIAITRPANFGWPFFEGMTRLMAGGPSSSVAPLFTYEFGDGPLAGSGLVAGAIYTGAFEALDGKVILGDVNGSVWTLGFDFESASFENRSADFVPDVGEIDEVVKILVDEANVVYILDADGDLFRVDFA